MAAAAIRPLREGDIGQAAAVAEAAIREVTPKSQLPVDEARALRARENRLKHLIATDPDGLFVAETNGTLVGVALSLVRDRVWGLSTLAVGQRWRNQGIGRLLLAEAVAYREAANAEVGLICSSGQPGAMRRYAKAGFRAVACLDAEGVVRHRVVPPMPRIVKGDVNRDRGTIDSASLWVRGAGYGRDLPQLLACGHELLVAPGRGFAVHLRGAPHMVTAHDEEAAAALLWSCLAATARNAIVQIGHITNANRWALRVALDAGLAPTLAGPLFVSGPRRRLSPWIPSPPYL